MKANLTGVPETLFITLRVRAAETKRRDAAISDSYAVEMMKEFEFDQSAKDKVSAASHTGTIVRTIILDQVINRFVEKHPQGVIVNLGCGLDARCMRLALNGCLWFDIDVKESIDVRKHFFKETPSYKMIAKSMFDYTWMDAVLKDHPVLFISEGVMMYFEGKDIRALFSEIAGHFVHVEIAFDVVNEWAVKNYKRHPDVKKYNAPFKWGVDDVFDMLQWHLGYKLVKEYYYADYLKKRWPLSLRMMYMLFPSFRRTFRIIQLQLG